MAKLKLYIHGFDSADVGDLAKWKPADRSAVYYFMEISIGAARDRGDLFGLVVATPEGIRKKCGRGMVSGRHMLVVNGAYRWRDVVEWVRGTVERCREATWEACAAKLSRHFHWEYEDYRVVD